MDDKYVKGFLHGIILTISIIAASVLVYFVFFNDALKNSSKPDSSTTASNNDGVLKEDGDYNSFSIKQQNIIKIINEKYYQDVDEGVLYRGAIDGMMAALDDPYSCYYSKDELDTITQTTVGEYVGIGCYVAILKEESGIRVISVIEGSPAEKAGMLANDIITAVDGTDISNFDIDYALSLVKGKAGTKVVITVKRENETLELTMTREKIEPKTIAYEMLDNNVGYIYVASFYGHTAEQFKKALADLESQGMEKLIVDLRDDPGGLYDSAIDMLDIFLGKDLLAAYIENTDGTKEHSYTKDEDEFTKPVVILINGNSASASELFTQTMREYGKVTIIGTKSFGKGVYQNIYPVSSDGSAVKVTGGRYFSPNGVCIHGVGIEPDIIVEYIEPGEDADSWEDDNQIVAAMEFFENR